MKGILEYLREMNAQTAQATRNAQPCKRVPLPEAFELPRRFGVSWGCLKKGVYGGVDAVVVDATVKGVRMRYVLPYDAERREYLSAFKRREEREERGVRLPQYFADALYELAERYEVEITSDVYVLVNGVEVDKTICYQRRSAEDCARAIERYVREERPRVAEERRRAEERKQREALRREIYAAVEKWFEGCFKMPIPAVSEVVEKLEEYYARCEVTKAVREEFGPDVAPGWWAKDGFWWDGELMGKPLSCFIRWHKAFCKWGNATWHFKVAEAEDGVYIKPDTPLVDRWIKVAHRGEYEIGN